MINEDNKRKKSKDDKRVVKKKKFCTFMTFALKNC